MRKVLLIAAATVGGVIILVAGLLIYAALNLNSIVKSDRQYVLGRISASVGRDVQAQDIQIGLGWGVTLEVAGLQIADDPAFSQLPFLKARQMSGQVEVLALLSGQILITRLAMLNPDVRILRDRAGRLNISTLGPRGAAARPGGQAQAHQPAGKVPIRFLVQDLSVRNGAVFYQEVPASGPTIEAGHINLDLSDVNPTRPFPVKLGLAALGGAQNLAVSGTVGPLMRGGTFEVMDAPLSFSITAGPMLLDRLRKFPELKSRIPNKLSMPDPVTVHAKIKGTPRALGFEVNTDLGSARLVYLGAFHKPAGTAFQISASGFRRDTALEISQAKIKLADLQARLSDLKFGNGAWSAKVDTNRFDLAPLAKMAAALAKYALAGSSEAHVAVASAAPVPRVRGTLALAGVGFKVEGSKLPGITDLTGTVRMDGNSATLEPTNFNLGSARAGLQGQASSLQPLRASYSFHADGFKLAELVPERPADEQVSQLAANGTVATRPDGFAVATALTSGEGMVSNVPYRNLALRADYNGRQANVTALTLNAYGGSIAAKGDAILAAPRPFHASVNLTNVDVQQALAAQKAKAADLVKGSLSGQINATGNSANVNQLALTAALTSPQGVVSDLEFRNLALRAGVSGGRADISSLTLNAYGGSIAAKGDAAVASPHPFRASLNLTNIDLQQALTAQRAKAANVVRGWLTGQINATGKGDNFEEIKPTLQGNGRIQIINGKLIGVNVVGSALKKINGIPVINTLITPSVMGRYPALFNSPDTDLKVARLSYVMTGPRMTSHDITVNSDDYQILGSGWFDMDKNVDLSVHLLMSRQFSTDLQAEKKNVVYLENQGGEIEIPLLVTGQLPHPSVQPDVQYLVQRAATQAVQQQGTKLLNKYIGGNKGVGKYLGGLGGGNGGAPSGGNPPSNPIAPLENLFH